MAQTKHWRSQLFSMLGTGFQDDKYVQDGIHLRWSSQPQLGLPIENENGATGVYRVYYLQDNLPPLTQADLFTLKNNPLYPVRSNLSTNNDTGMDTTYPGGHRFFKKVDPNLSAILYQYFSLAHWLQTHLLKDEEKALLNYLNGVLGQLRPELYDTNWAYEIGEVCAVDASFKLTQSKPGAYAWVRGYDRHGRLLAEDWVGKDKTSTKGTARLRSPHLYSIRIEPVEGMPPIIQQEICWIFCDDYCRAGIWREAGVERRFRLDEYAYKEDRVKEFYYAPFQVDLDWASISHQLTENLVFNYYIKEMAHQVDTYQMSRFAADLGTENPADQQTFPNIQLPVLASLIHSATDPAMANILGLYAWEKPSLFPPKRDYKVEAHLPFFHADNLVKLRDQVLAIAAAQGVPFTTLELEKLSALPPGVDPGTFHRSTSLCGLILGPEPSLRPLPYSPNPFATQVTSLDLLSQENPEEAEIYVNSRLQVEKPAFTTAPYLQPASYMVERKLSGTDFANVIEAEDSPDPLDELGVLPAVYMPKAVEGRNYWELRDDFRLPQVQEDNVQYRLTAFDIFGRPSESHEGSVEPVTIPCYQPVAATSLTAQVNREQNDLNLELYFAVSGTVPPLHAVPQVLEMTIHPVNPFDPAPVDEINWPGSITGRTFTVNYLADGTFLDVAQLTPGCASLAWVAGELVRTALPAGSCDADFPLDPSTLSLVAPMSAMMDEGDTGYRLYRFNTKIGEADDLVAGLHRWCVRVRIQGVCQSGAILTGRDVSTAAQYMLLAPPPAVIQPPLVVIPESTYPDRQGDAFYNLDLSHFIPAAIANDSPLVNIYRVMLPHLADDPAEVVDGDFFAPGGDMLVQSLGRSARRHFQRVNHIPVVYTPGNRFYPIPVRGDLEEYHVVGVVGCTPQLDEKDWRQAGIMLFKTPKPVPTPQFRFVSVRPAVVADQVQIALDYHADFETEVAAGVPLPKVQIMRHDLSTGLMRFAGESTGVWDTATGGYHFRFSDNRAQPWRRYRYEASLLFHAGKIGQTVKAEQTAVCTVLAPEAGPESPYPAGYNPSVTTVNGKLKLTFIFTAGDFNVSLTKALADRTTQRVQGQLVEGNVLGIPNASLTVQRSSGRYTLSFLDNDTQPGTYTLRLWQGQKAAWPQKLEVA